MKIKTYVMLVLISLFLSSCCGGCENPLDKKNPLNRSDFQVQTETILGEGGETILKIRLELNVSGKAKNHGAEIRNINFFLDRDKSFGFEKVKVHCNIAGKEFDNEWEDKRDIDGYIIGGNKKCLYFAEGVEEIGVENIIRTGINLPDENKIFNKDNPVKEFTFIFSSSGHKLVFTKLWAYFDDDQNHGCAGRGHFELIENFAQPIVISREVTKEKTILIYMDGDNSLDDSRDEISPILKDINEMEKIGSDEKTHILALVDRRKEGEDNLPRLYYIEKDDDPVKVTSPVIKRYTELNMGDPRTLREFLDFSYKHFPAKEHSLIFWSHGTGWYPVSGEIKALSIGRDGSNADDGLTLEELVPALTDYPLDLLVFDACLMSEAEVVYPLRKIAPLVLASQSYQLSKGLNYVNLITSLKKEDSMEERLRGFLQKTRDDTVEEKAYLRKGDETLVKTENLEEFIQGFKLLLEKLDANTNKNLLKDIRKNLKLVDDQDLSRIDLGEWLDALNKTPELESPELKTTLDLYGKIVLDKYATEEGVFIATYKNFTGLTIYLPQTKEDAKHWDYYEKLDFNKETNWNKFVQIFWE